MAISNLNLNVTANTARALADFNKFSRSLDNKFLVSGLKLDVVRSALSQINRDFQRAIGEQGLASASSLRAAQNQAALLTQTFKGFASESALAITTNIGTALNRVAVTAGGTMKDVQKTLLATPFISTKLSDDVRLGLSKGVLDFQKNIRRAGLGDNFGGVAQQFLMGTKTTMQMVQSGNPLEMFLGSELIKRGAGVGEIGDPKVRSELLGLVTGDKELSDQLLIAAKRTAGFRIILEDMNSTLFNPESGVFGSLKKVVDSAGKSTTMFDEVEKLVGQVFGDNGLFATLVKSFRSVFGNGDPMRPFIDGVQFMTRIFKSITDYFNTPGFKAVLGYVKDIVDRVTSVFTGIYQQIRGGGFSAGEITRTIGEIGNSIRGYIRQFGEAIRNKDVSRESGFAGDILGTLVEEVGRTAVVLIKELLMTLVDKVPEIATAVLPAINKGINAILTEAFGQTGAALVKFIAGFVPGPIGMIARASAVGDVTGGGGSVGSMLAMGAAAALTPGSVMAARGFAIRQMAATRQHLGGFGLPLRYGYGVARGAGNLFGMGLQGAGNLSSRLLGGLRSGPGATVSGYLGGIGPLLRGGASAVQGQYSALSGFAMGQRSQFMAGFRPPFPNVAVGAGTTRAYNLGQFAKNLPGMVSGLPSNVLSSLGNMATSVSQFGTNLATSASNAAGAVGAAGQRVGSSLIAMGSSLLTSSRTAIGNMATAVRNLVASVLAIGSRILASSVAAIGNILVATRNIVASLLSMGLETLKSAGILVGKIATTTGNIVTSQFTMGTSVLTSGQQTARNINLAKAAVGLAAAGAIAISTQAIGQKIGGNTGETVADVGAISSGAFSGIMTAAGISALRGAPFGPKGMAIGAILGAVTAAIPALMTNTVKNNYSGRGYAGPAMALEARMSGRRPMVVNDGEFVIPRDGFPTLAGLVGDNLRSTGAMNHGTSQPVQVNVTLAITTHSVVADPNELVNALRDPVYKIIGEAWNEAYNSTRIHRAKVS
jgi:hypothetical protein